MDHLPESCDACPCQYDLIACQAASIETFYEDSFTIFDESTSRHPNCPLRELVLCKDCKWFNDIGCAIRIVDDSDKPTENDYCSFGERKSNDNNTCKV